jgi:hypothetical protein
VYVSYQNRRRNLICLMHGVLNDDSCWRGCGDDGGGGGGGNSIDVRDWTLRSSDRINLVQSYIFLMCTRTGRLPYVTASSMDCTVPVATCFKKFGKT